MPTSLSLSLRRLWTLDKFAYSLRVFLAFSGALLLSWVAGDIALMIPLFLGIIASALSETDDSWQGRLQALVVTLICFAVASLVVLWLFPWPWLFAAGLGVATFVLIMLGAVGQRYATIASGTLILAIYTMINIEHHGGVPQEGDWSQTLLILSGAAWYGAISVVWCALFSRQPLKQSMAELYRELGKYLILKATLFEPLRGVDIEARRLALARQNGRVVGAMNQAKEMIFRRLEGQRGSRKLNRYLRIYFIAQDIHERASSSHYPYAQLTEAFFHHDVLFRCQRLLDQQGLACKRLGKALLLNRSFEHDQSEQALADLHASIANLRDMRNPAWRELLPALNALADNLASLEEQLATAHNPDAADEAPGDTSLFDRSPGSFKEAWERIRLNLTVTSPTFRHAVRLPLALLAGYGLLHLLPPAQSFWILLTTLFVCRPNFGATRRFLSQRIVGTVLGLVVGWASITLFPGALLQTAIAVIAGVTFFATRERHYVIATAAITLLVLCSFNQIGDGFDLIWPRLFDTLIGALAAGLAVLVVLPDWQARRLHRQAASTLAASHRYLQEILHQYRSGKQDDLAYRLARRNAHNADAELSTVLSNMLQEPHTYRRRVADDGFRFLVHSHTLLSYLSALGAHRQRLEPKESDWRLLTAAEGIADYLKRLADCLARREPLAGGAAAREALQAELTALPPVWEEEGAGLHTQLGLIVRQLEPLTEAASRLAGAPLAPGEPGAGPAAA
ncbi:YccS family putative transporter [Billgrantia kenyensis]|uniref:TIGR01666 family membrane protein n=1 Tax=Billgrantia kenyensis TaxID=321266 RepID=A0A7V9VYI8_9GAMM|nr:YccS family putative transporter [Halomonas kenyensis]MBA2777798.1 TIGR01666 family membrane protein [Halomonas kenyensis]MCG6661269.1 TIGR01666 family membrane protein [Halomonas kenyensis]